jgi:hypothetical protein
LINEFVDLFVSSINTRLFTFSKTAGGLASVLRPVVFVLRASQPEAKVRFAIKLRVPFSVACFLWVGAGGLMSASLADWKDDVGFTQLQNEVGAGLESGAGVRVSMSEAFVGNNYLFDFSSSQFSGKTLTDGSNIASGISGHANGVASRFFGNTGSIAPGVADVTIYQADDWLNRVMGVTSGADPQIQDFRIMNNSWIGNFSTAESIDRLNRVDFMVDRDDVLVLGGANNGSSSAVPHLLASGYNSMIVGRSDGNHSHGPTVINGAGRYIPHIVAPAPNTSNATPMVASAAALLHEKAIGTDAARSETMRAVLMAGATKQEFASWDRTTTRPLDQQYGAGELNVYNSYQILEGGEFNASATQPSFTVGLSGWDYVDAINASDTFFYDFEVGDGFQLDELSISLNWNLNVTDTNASPDIFDPVTSLTNLDMRFFDSSDSFLGTEIDASLSTVDNLEHIYLRNLAAGRYTLQISADGTTDYGLAWRSTISAVPEPTSWFVMGAIAAAVSVRHRRRMSRNSAAI